MFRTVRLVPIITVAAASFVLGMAAPVVALQNAPDRVIAIKSDGSAFFLQFGQRFAVTVAPLTDEQIDAIPLASVPANLSTNVPPVVSSGGPDRWIVEPGDAVGLDLLHPIPQGAICHCSVDRRGKLSVFEISIDEVMRDAWPLVRQANRFNRAPDDVNGYLAVKVTMRYLDGPTDDAFQVSATDFKLVGSDRTLRPVASIFDPEPRLTGSIFPGASVSGYLVYDVRKDEKPEVLLFETNFNGERGVWFTLGRV